MNSDADNSPKSDSEDDLVMFLTNSLNVCQLFMTFYNCRKVVLKSPLKFIRTQIVQSSTCRVTTNTFH